VDACVRKTFVRLPTVKTMHRQILGRRFKLQILLDEASLLPVPPYVGPQSDSCGIAETPETSDYTGAERCIDDLGEREGSNAPSTPRLGAGVAGGARAG